MDFVVWTGPQITYEWIWLFSSKNVFDVVSCIWLSAILWTAARQASLSSISQRLLKLMSTESVRLCNHFLLCLLLLPSIFPSIRYFPMSLPKFQCFSTSPSNEYSGLIYFRTGLAWSSCCPRDFWESSTIPQFKSINSFMLSIFYGLTFTLVHDCQNNHSFDNRDFFFPQ